jgi:hypothetical protein
MKVTLGLFLSLAVLAINAQGPTVTEGLLAAQEDLALSHRFFEQTVFANRNLVSTYLYRINREIIDSHIDTYAFIKETGRSTLDSIEAKIPESSEEEVVCVNRIINRWNLQKLR